MGLLHLVFHITNLLWLTKVLALASSSLAKSGCDQEKCGDVAIPYPFGIGATCWLDQSFAIDCNNSTSPPKPFLSRIGLEVLNISVGRRSTILVNNPVFYWNCPGRNSSAAVNLGGSPFMFSDSYNIFIAVGCNNQAIMTQDDLSTISGCKSNCGPNTTLSPDNICNGINCCQTSIPWNLTVFNVTWNKAQCSYAFLEVQYGNLTNPFAVNSTEFVPAMLEWTLNNDSNLLISPSPRDRSFSCEQYSIDYKKIQCYCEYGYEGNPYLPDGCHDIDECKSNDPYVNHCGKSCVNTRGSYHCGNRVKIAIIGISCGVGLLFLLIGLRWLYKVMKCKEKIFKRNGGLLLLQKLSSIDGGIEKTKLFNSKELETATDNYNENRVLGQGGQGTVYKGMLKDGRIIAVKKSKMVDEGNIEQFINEVIILSQINHRNVVKLLGCCLETEVPLLVYEFVSNGTLFEHIHDPNEEFPLSWEMRLQIAIEIAEAIFYLHSAASVPIYHRDIKSTNVLLDDKYKAKVSDFGTSRSVAVDQTHLTTLVKGTFGYLDPKYFQSSQFTEKSDVYSFGVVIVELLTGQKAISLARLEENISLTTYFIQSMKENHLLEIVDPRVLKKGRKEELLAVAHLAKRCLHPSGTKKTHNERSGSGVGRDSNIARRFHYSTKL